MNYDDVTTNGMVPSVHVEGDIIRSELIFLKKVIPALFGKNPMFFLSNIILFPARSMTS